MVREGADHVTAALCCPQHNFQNNFEEAITNAAVACANAVLNDGSEMTLEQESYTAKVHGLAHQMLVRITSDCG